MPLWYLVDNDRRITNETYELQAWPADTMHAVAERLADGIAGSLRLGSAVAAIDWSDGVIATTTSGQRFEADGVIVAAAPVAARRIAFSPPLPGRLPQALGAWESGSVVKAQLIYARASGRHAA